MKFYFSNKEKPVCELQKEGKKTFVRIYLASDRTSPMATYSYERYSISLKDAKYDYIVNMLITEKYPNDKMQAIQNNYAFEPENEKYAAEWNDMQEYRRTCKQIAHEVIEMIEDKGN